MNLASYKFMKNIPAPFSADLIPAFLSPGHILSRAKDVQVVETNNANSNNIRKNLHRALDENQIDLFMQPIVTLPQRRVQFYELFSRLRMDAGLYLPAQEYMALAQEEHLVNQHDTLLLTHLLKILKTQQVSCFINIKPFTLRNRLFMNNLLDILSRYRNIAQAIIFEMPYNDFLMLSPAEQKILHGLAKLGCRYSVDHVDEIPTDVQYLHARHVRFVKIAAKTILSEGKTNAGFSDILSKKHNLDVNGIEMIVEKVEQEHDLLEILDYDIKYGQGFLFGRPDFQGVYAPDL